MRKALFPVSVVIAFVAMILSMPCRGQEYRATVTGTVTDASKAVIPKATVSVRNLDTGEVTTVQSNSAGVYVVSFCLFSLRLRMILWISFDLSQFR